MTRNENLCAAEAPLHKLVISKVGRRAVSRVYLCACFCCVSTLLNLVHVAVVSYSAHVSLFLVDCLSKAMASLVGVRLFFVFRTSAHGVKAGE